MTAATGRFRPVERPPPDDGVIVEDVVVVQIILVVGSLLILAALAVSQRGVLSRSSPKHLVLSVLGSVVLNGDRRLRQAVRLVLLDGGFALLSARGPHAARSI